MATLQNERGAALITALVILALLTIIGMAATNTSTLETLISATEKNHSEAFYAAEAGIEHLRRKLQNDYLTGNFENIATESPNNWNFALKGPTDDDPETGPATDTNYSGGALWFNDISLGGKYLYDVTIWNNADGGTALHDEDEVIYMRADAWAPDGGSASIEIMLKGWLTEGSAINDNNAQGSGGGGKNSSGNDVGAVNNFDRQLQ